MIDSERKIEILIASNSHRRLIRGMGANGLLITLLAFILLLHFAAIEYKVSAVFEYLLAVGGLAFYGRIYSSYVARVLVSERDVRLIKSLNEVTYSKQMIEHVDIRRSKVFGIIKIRVRLIGKRAPKVFRSMCPIGEENISKLKETWFSSVLSTNINM